MFTNLKAKNHKGISELKIGDLGHINIICGKNNSGKTSILEALNSPNNFALGKKVDSKDWLEELFALEAMNYSDPNPDMLKRWFSKYISETIQKHTIWYSDEYEKIIEDINRSMRKDPGLGHYGVSLIDFKKILDTYFALSKYKTILILKNQIPSSTDFKTFEKIYSAFKQITGYSFNIISNNKNQIILYFKSDEGEWLRGDACGLGLSDILVMVTFAIDSDCAIIFIEEPENHLHPEIQKKILGFIKSVKSKQFLLSTHSNIILNPYIVDKIFYVYFNKTVIVSDETSKSEILYNLGYSVADNLVADAVILTEGPSDIPVLNTIFDWMGLGDKYNIRFWPLGGDIMAYLDLSIFAEKNNVFALIDSDPGSNVTRTRFERNCRDLGITCHRLERYSLENYFTLEAIRKVITDIPETTIELQYDKNIDDQLGFENSSIKPKNHKIIQNMSIKDIENTDLYSFCKEIESFLENGPANKSISES
ncbi:MAG: AAA family ATPase [Methanothrix sp.]|nr:AAA family ATPase [Methanothrix sp.]